MQRIDIIGSEINIINMAGVINQIENSIKNSNKSDYICVSNVHTVVMGRRYKRMRDITNKSLMAIPDGMPLVWYGRLAGNNKMGKCSGPDLMAKMFKISEAKGFTNFFYGNTAETLEILKKILQYKYPALKVVGMHAPPFRPLNTHEDFEIIDHINSIDPDIIWVGLGAPKQELWMAEHVEKIKSSVIIGVGAAFNFHAETVRRAPLWMQKTGLEWFYRLIQEPRKLWNRYLVTNTLFIYYVFKNLMSYLFRRKKINGSK